jgi:ribose transport system ATP-binding protein
MLATLSAYAKRAFEMSEDRETILLETVGISKQYPGVQALDDVSLSVQKGEVRGLVGENGAGKSTLIKVIGGLVDPDQGTILWEGEETRIPSPQKADEIGIAIVHQELSLFPNLDVATNLFVTSLNEGVGGFVPDKALREKALAVLDTVGLSHISPRRKVGTLKPGEQQLVEIGRSIVKNARLIILDEPTSSLAEKEIQTLFQIIRRLKTEGVSVIFVSHRLDEVFEICDTITVLRDGCHIQTAASDQMDRSTLIYLILGRQMSEMYQDAPELKPGVELLRVENLHQTPKLKGLNLTLHEGEILGIAGLLGSGRSELVRSIFGLEKYDEGEVFVRGRPVRIRSPQQAIKAGIGYVTEDRHKEGIILEKPVKDNIAVANLQALATPLGWMRPSLELEAARRQKERLNIITPSLMRKVKFLSGGNQQKVVLGKWLEIQPEIYIMDEPTRGIDVGAKAEFYKIIISLAEQGAGIIFISSELQEIINICHRVLVLRNGRFVSEFAGGQINAAKILMAMTGENHNGAN